MASRIAAALAAWLMLQSPLVFADATANATFSNIRIELIDLDPGDGITPDVIFHGFSSSLAVTDFGPTNLYTQVQNNATTSFGTVSVVSPPSPDNSASASFAGDVYFGTGMATASAWVKGIRAPFGATTTSVGRTMFGDDGSPPTNGFVLSPHTELIISGWADLEGETTPGGDGQQTYSHFDMYIDGATSAGVQHSQASLDATLDATSLFGSVTSQQALSVSFSNGDATAASGFFMGFLNARAVSNVPEPSIAMMLSMALAAMLFGSVQRKRA